MKHSTSGWAFSVVVVVLLILLLGVACAPPAPAPSAKPSPAPSPTPPVPEVKKYVIRLQCHAPLDNFAFLRTQRWGKMVEDSSNGQVEFKYYGSNQLAPAGEALNAVSKGAFEMLMTAAGLFGGSNNIGGWFMMPYTFKSPEDAFSAWWDKGLAKIVDDTYQKRSNVKCLYYQMIPGQTLFSTKPVNKLEDWKQLTVGAQGADQIKTVQALGGAVAGGIGPPEAYVNFQRGTIDATWLVLNGVRAYKLDEAGVKYILQPNIVATTQLGVWINTNTWNSLPDGIKKVMLDKAKQATLDDIKFFTEGEKAEMDYGKSKGIQYPVISQEELTRWYNVAAPELRNWYLDLCDKQGIGDEAKKIIEIMKASW